MLAILSTPAPAGASAGHGPGTPAPAQPLHGAAAQADPVGGRSLSASAIVQVPPVQPAPPPMAEYRDDLPRETRDAPPRHSEQVPRALHAEQAQSEARAVADARAEAVRAITAYRQMRMLAPPSPADAPAQVAALPAPVPAADLHPDASRPV